MPTTAPRRCWAASIDLLERLDVWPRCRDQAAALRIMRLVDDTGRLIRAPEVRFSCDEIGLDAFGYNIENRSLMVALEERAAELSGPDPVRRRGGDDRPAGRDRRHPYRQGRAACRAAGGRRRRAAIAVPRGRRHRGQPPRPESVGADLQHRPFAAARQHLHRVSHRRTVRAYSCRCPATAAAWCGSRRPGKPNG